MSVRSGRLAVLVILVAGCGANVLTPPPDPAAPEVVLRAYLDALVKGDCSAGKVLGTATFTRSNGDLCGQTTVQSYRIIGDHPATPNASEADFATGLVTTGSADGTVNSGALTWFYQLQRAPGGPWRLTGGGSGP
jgi:hypothetical protein